MVRYRPRYAYVRYIVCAKMLLLTIDFDLRVPLSLCVRNRHAKTMYA